VVRPRRYRQRWLFAWAFAAATVAEATAAVLYYVAQPIPPLPPWTLHLELGGKGTGSVNVALAGEPAIIARCTTDKGSCKVEIPRGRWVTLTAVRGDKMTFEGWQACEPYAEDVLGCELMMFQDRAVALTFGEVPKELEVAWVEPPPDSKVKLPKLPTPQAPIEAEKLDVTAPTMAARPWKWKCRIACSSPTRSR